MITNNYNQLADTTHYDYVANEKGHTEAIHKDTGEILTTKTITVPVGSIVYTPDQQDAYKARKEQERQLALRRNGSQKFTFVNAESEYKDLPPETVGRLMYLCTYLGYHSNSLTKTQKTKLTKKDLPDILKLPRSTFLRFWKDVEGKYLFEDKDGYIGISGTCFVRGKLPYIGGTWQKVYGKSMQELYRALPRTSHRYLGYVFQLLPYLNYEYNILCHNPEETELDKINCMTLDEFCIACGYTATEQRARLIKSYARLKFDVNGKKERFLSFVTDLVDIGQADIYVNPHVIYKGHNPNDVKILGKFCK